MPELSEARGSILIMTAVTMVALLAITALAVDASYFFDYRNKMAAAADAAALAGARAVKNGYSDTYMTRFAQNQATLNYFEDGSNGVTVTINHPPSSGPFSGDSSAVEAIVRRATTPTFFARLFRASVDVGTRAVAGSGPINLANIYALCQSCKGIEITSAIQVTMNAGVYDYSTGSPGLVLNSNSATRFNCPQPTCPGIFISASEANSTNCTQPNAYCSPATQPPVVYNYPPPGGASSTWQQRDPFGGTLAAPACPACATFYTTDQKCDPTCTSTGTNVLQPADFRARISLTSGIVYLNGGVYKISGVKDFIVSGTTAVYTCGAPGAPSSPAGCTDNGGITLLFTGTGSLKISDPVIWRPRNQLLVYQLGNQLVTISSGGALDIAGIVYTPTADVSFTGGSTGTSTFMTSFIANKFGMGGNGASYNFNPVPVLIGGGPVSIGE